MKHLALNQYILITFTSLVGQSTVHHCLQTSHPSLPLWVGSVSLFPILHELLSPWVAETD